MKPVILGLVNDKHRDSAMAMEPHTPNGSGERLWAMVNELTRCSKEDYVSRFTFLNLLEEQRERYYEERLADRVVDVIVKVCFTPCVVLGREVWELLDHPRDAWWYDTYANYHLVPHPSGLNHLYNDERYRRRTGELLARLGGWS